MSLQQQRLSRSVIAGPAVPGLTGVTLLARVRGGDGRLLTRASLLAVNWSLANLSTGTVLSGGALVLASSVFDALQQSDPRWQVDSAAAPGPDGAWGYNFAGTIPAAMFPLAQLAAPASPFSSSGKLVQVQADVAFTPVSGEPWRVSFQWRMSPVYG